MPDDLDLDPSQRFPAGLPTDLALSQLHVRLTAVEEALTSGGRLTVAAVDQAAYDRQVAEAQADADAADAAAAAQAQAGRDAQARLASLRDQRPGAPGTPGALIPTPAPEPALAPTPEPVTAGPPSTPGPFGRELLGP